MDRDGRVGFVGKDEVDQAEFHTLWPSETSGDGKITDNNQKTGAGQGKASFTTKVHCKQCGYPLDINQNDVTGGSLDGNGAGGAISVSTVTATFPNGTVYTEIVGTQAYNPGGGCPLCFSKNSSDDKFDLSQNIQPFDSIPRAGF